MPHTPSPKITPPETPSDQPRKPTRANPVKRKCDNCGKMYLATRADARFCKARCRGQYHENRTAYGQLKEKLSRFITKEIRRQWIELVSKEGIDVLQAAGERRRKRAEAEKNSHSVDTSAFFRK